MCGRRRCVDDHRIHGGAFVSDIGLTWDPASGSADFAIEDGDLAVDEGLRTAVMLSLFLDRRAEPGDVLPEGTDRRGSWMDLVPVVTGDKIGSRLWLLARVKQTADVLPRAREYAREALEWLTVDKVATAVDVVAEFMSEPRGLALAVTIHRPKLDPVTYRFGSVWAAEESRA